MFWTNDLMNNEMNEVPTCRPTIAAPHRVPTNRRTSCESGGPGRGQSSREAGPAADPEAGAGESPAARAEGPCRRRRRPSSPSSAGRRSAKTCTLVRCRCVSHTWSETTFCQPTSRFSPSPQAKLPVSQILFYLRNISIYLAL